MNKNAFVLIITMQIGFASSIHEYLISLPSKKSHSSYVIESEKMSEQIRKKVIYSDFSQKKQFPLSNKYLSFRFVQNNRQLGSVYLDTAQKLAVYISDSTGYLYTFKVNQFSFQHFIHVECSGKYKFGEYINIDFDGKNIFCKKTK